MDAFTRLTFTIHLVMSCCAQSSFSENKDGISHILNSVLVLGTGLRLQQHQEDQQRVDALSKLIRLKAHPVVDEKVTFKIVQTYTQHANGGINYYHHLNASNGKQYSTCIFVSWNLGIPDQVFLTDEGYTAPHDGFIHPLSVISFATGAFSWHIPTVEDQARVNAFEKLISEKRHLPHTTKYLVTGAWIQVVNGVNYFYHLVGSDKHLYSVLFYQDPNGGIAPRVVYVNDGYTPPSGSSEEVHLTLSSGSWNERDTVLPFDRLLVTSLNTFLSSLIGKEQLKFTVHKAYTQVTHGTNYFYHLLGSNEEKYSTCISQSLNGAIIPHINFIEEGWNQPHSELILSLGENFQVSHNHIGRFIIQPEVTQRDQNLVDGLLGKDEKDEKGLTYKVHTAYTHDLSGAVYHFYHLIGSNHKKYSTCIKTYTWLTLAPQLLFVEKGWTYPHTG